MYVCQYVRNVIATVDPTMTEDDAKAHILNEIDQYMQVHL